MRPFYIKDELHADAVELLNMYTEAGYTAVLLPNSSGGINQPAFRDLRISFNGTAAQELRAHGALRPKLAAYHERVNKRQVTQ
jgi:hypothetical protein